MHASIEFIKKHTEIFVPQQWTNSIRTARRKDLYMVVPLNFGDIYDFKELTKQTMKYCKEDSNKKKANWHANHMVEIPEN